MISAAILFLSLGLCAIATPVPNSAVSSFSPAQNWDDGASSTFKVWGDGCNTTQLELIGKGLAQTEILVDHARAHLRRFGNDTTFQRWFGKVNHPNRLQGLYDRIIDGDKGNVSFTCNDIDNLCNGKYGIIPGYFSPSVAELTVVCPTYYLSKAPLDELCTRGRTIASQGSESTDGSWFLHRLLHLSVTSGGGLSDIVDTAAEAVQLANGVNNTQAIQSIHTIQYYALDAYASDILLPGQGCLGDTSAAAAASERRKRELGLTKKSVTH